MSKSIKLNDDTFISIDSIRGGYGFPLINDADNAFVGFSIYRGDLSTLGASIWLILTLPALEETYTNDYQRQFAIGFDRHNLNERSKVNGDWSSWKSITFS